jgi:hypothetical protein
MNVRIRGNFNTLRRMIISGKDSAMTDDYNVYVALCHNEKMLSFGNNRNKQLSDEHKTSIGR